MARNARAVSTVVDVALAMVLLSAAVVLLGVYLADDPPEPDPVDADRSAETVAGTTLVVEYDLEAVEDEDTFDETWIEDDDAYERVRHGPTAGLIADAATANAEFWGDPMTVEGEEFEDAVDGATITTLAGADVNYHVRAVWRPYEGADVVGVATAGERPPPNDDVNSVTMTAPSGMDVDTEDLRDDYRDAGAVEEEVATAIVDGTFPPRRMQHALESQGMERELVAYRYQEMAEILDRHSNWDPDDPGGYLNRSAASAVDANEDLVEGMTSDDVLPGSNCDDCINFETSDWNDDRDEVVEFVTVDEVQITIRTWEG